MVIFVLFLYIVKNIAYDSSRHLLSFPPLCCSLGTGSQVEQATRAECGLGGIYCRRVSPSRICSSCPILYFLKGGLLHLPFYLPEACSQANRVVTFN